MKKKVLALIISAMIITNNTGCRSEPPKDATSYTEEYNELMPFAKGYFTVIYEWRDSQAVYRIMYANDNKVMYFMSQGQSTSGITGLYNPDGTMQTYTDDKNDIDLSQLN